MEIKRDSEDGYKTAAREAAEIAAKLQAAKDQADAVRDRAGSQVVSQATHGPKASLTTTKWQCNTQGTIAYIVFTSRCLYLFAVLCCFTGVQNNLAFDEKEFGK